MCQFENGTIIFASINFKLKKYESREHEFNAKDLASEQ